ncbi:MAG: hypothetical protein IJR00_01335 [Lachnospiraceae bacterium]|nr:hypothetical protein [Lachnospiraceae bacterium]
MNALLQKAQQEVKKLRAAQEKQNGDETVEIYLDWGRDGKGKKQLLTVIKNVPKSIIKALQNKQKRDPKQYIGLD